MSYILSRMNGDIAFGSDLDKFAKKADKRVNQARRKGVLDLFSAVIRSTPVDTGRARGNWQSSVGQSTDQEVDRNDKSGAAAIQDASAAVASWGDDETLYMTNNLPYIGVLEDGSSQQAPPGAMVKLNVKRFEPLLKAAAAQARK